MCDACQNPDHKPTLGSRRRRLWDLPHSCHCPVVGVCLPLDVLRKLVNKVLAGRVMADDYEVHVGAVAECLKRNRLSEALQDELDKRYAVTIQSYKSVKTTVELSQRWTQAIEAGDVAGAFWAALTHPRCDEVFQEVLLRDMHMIQHQAGAARRVDIHRVEVLAQENGVLMRELARAQERSSKTIQDKCQEVDRLQADLLKQRAEGVYQHTRIHYLESELADLRSQGPDSQQNEKLQRKLDQAQERNNTLQGQLADLRRRLDALSIERDQWQQRAQALERAVQPEPTAPVKPVVEHPIHWMDKTVLCVGGRSGNVASYRDAVERMGGQFVHHDGGLEDSSSGLESSLASADLVICQTGCISHNAYWRVKDYCKRHGKQCVFVENPSTSSLLRSLEGIHT